MRSIGEYDGGFAAAGGVGVEDDLCRELSDDLENEKVLDQCGKSLPP